MNSVNVSRFAASQRGCGRSPILTAAGAIGTASQADAAFLLLDGLFRRVLRSRQDRHPDIPRQKPQKRVRGGQEGRRRREGSRRQAAGPASSVVVSIERQKVTVYDSNGVFAENLRCRQA